MSSCLFLHCWPTKSEVEAENLFLKPMRQVALLKQYPELEQSTRESDLAMGEFNTA